MKPGQEGSRNDKEDTQREKGNHWCLQAPWETGIRNQTWVCRWEISPEKGRTEGVDGSYVSLTSKHRTCNCLRRGNGSTCFNWHLKIGSCTTWNPKSQCGNLHRLCNYTLMLLFSSYMLLCLHQYVNNPGQWTWHSLVVNLKLSLFCLLLYSKPSLINIGILSWD